MLKLFRQLSLASQWPMLAAVLVLTCMGMLTIWSDQPAAGKKQLLFLGIAVMCLGAFQLVDYRILGARYSALLYIGSAVLIAYTVLGSIIRVPGVSARNSAYNWISFGPFSLQPSELMKVGFVLVLARYLRFRSNYRTIYGLIPPFALAAFPMLLILKQPDLGTALVFIPALFAMLFAAGAKVKHLFGVVGMGLAVMPFVWLCGLEGVPVFEHMPSIVKQYQRDRVYAMFSDDPDVEETGTGMQQYRALIAMGSGGITGNGIGEVRAGKRVPERQNDMIFALIGEQFGFIGSVVVIACYMVIFVIGIETAGSTREPFGRLVAIGIVAMLSGQTFINLLVATKLMPVTGVTLPFVSSGGSSLIASFMSIGLLLNIGQKRPIVMGKKVFEYQD